MHQLHFLIDILILLAAAVVFVYLSRRLRTSPVLGYLAAGILIGPQALGLIETVEDKKPLAELGVVFLLFSIGLELSFRRLASMRREVFGLGTAQVVATGTVLTAGQWALGVNLTAAVVIGFGVALSSTAMVLQVLSERGELSSRMGRTAFSILLLQDIAIVPLLALLPLLGRAKGGATDWAAVGISVATAAGALAAIVVAGRYLLQPLFKAVAGLRTQEVFIAIILLAVLGTAWATEQVGLSMTLGAFLAGLMLAETEFRHQIEVDIRPFQGLLMGLFFITIGMSLDLRFAAQHIVALIALTALLLVIKAAIVYALIRWLMGLSTPLSLRVGLILAQGGEFALVLVAVGVRDDLVPDAVSQLMLAVVILSMATTPFLAMLGRWLSARLERSVAIGLAALEQENLDLVDHVIIAGFGRTGQTIARIAESHRIPYVVLDLNPTRVEEGRAKGLPIFYGDASRPELMWGVGIDRARAFVSSIDAEPAKVTQLVGLLHRRLPELKILVRARDETHAAALQRAGATAAVPDVLVSSLHLARSMVTAFGLPPTEMTKLIEDFQKEAPPQAAE